MLVALGQPRRQRPASWPWSSRPIMRRRSAPIARPPSTAANARRLANADRDLAAHNGISAREAAQAQTDAASAEADRDAALQSADGDGSRPGNGREGACRKSGSRCRRGSHPRAGFGDGRRKADHARPAAPGRFDALRSPSPTSRRCGCSRRSHRATLHQVGIRRCGADRPGQRHRTVPRHCRECRRHRSTRIRERSWRGSSLPIPATCSRSRCMSTSRSSPARVSTGLLVPVSAVLRDDENLPFVYVALPDGSFARRHVTLGYRDAQNLRRDQRAAERRPSRRRRRDLPSVHAEPMSDDPAQPPRDGSSFINRIVAASLEQRILVLLLTVLADRRRRPRVEPAAGRRLPRSVAADGRDHHAMAGAFGGRGRAADHRADRARA